MIHAPVHDAIEVRHPDGTVNFVKAVQARYSPLQPLQQEAPQHLQQGDTI